MGNDPCVKRIVLASLLAVLMLPGCGGEVDPARTGAGAAQVRLFENLYDGRFGRAYDALYAPHQKIVPRKLFVDCARRTIAVHKLDSIEVLDVFDESVDLPVLGKKRAKGVRLRLTSTDGETATLVNHEVKTGSGWRWVLSAKAARAYRAGGCPGA
jgi:hypothetical protein